MTAWERESQVAAKGQEPGGVAPVVIKSRKATPGAPRRFWGFRMGLLTCLCKADVTRSTA